jgi:hypothetical protein
LGKKHLMVFRWWSPLFLVHFLSLFCETLSYFASLSNGVQMNPLVDLPMQVG